MLLFFPVGEARDIVPHSSVHTSVGLCVCVCVCVCVYMGGATGVCGGQCPPTFGTSGVQGVQGGGRSNENDLCFYSRQSLFITVQVTEFQFP